MEESLTQLAHAFKNKALELQHSSDVPFVRKTPTIIQLLAHSLSFCREVAERASRILQQCHKVIIPESAGDHEEGYLQTVNGSQSMVVQELAWVTQCIIRYVSRL